MIVTSVTSHINPLHPTRHDPPMFWWFFIQTWPLPVFLRPLGPFEALGMVEAEECIELLENGEKSEDSDSSEEGACRGPVNSIFLGMVINLWIEIYIFIYIHIYIYISYILNVYIYVYMCIYIYVYMYIYICIYIYMFIYIYMYIYMHIYICIYTYHISIIYTYIYIYIHIRAQIRTFAWSLCFSGKTTRVFNRPPRSRGRVLGVNFWFSRILSFRRIVWRGWQI